MKQPAGSITACVLGIALAAPLQGQSIDTLALRDHARALAADSLLGRATASAGERAAAAYIARQLEGAGVRAPGGFRLPLPLLRAALSPRSRITVGEGTTTFLPGRDFVLGRVGRGGLRAFEGPALFVGQIAEAPPPSTLAGHVVVTLGPLGEGAAAILRDWARSGVAGVLLPVAAEALGDAGATLVLDASVDDPVWQPALPILYAGPSLTAALFAGVSTEARPTDLPRVRADLTFDTQPTVSANLYGAIPGTDPALRDEVVLLTAHYDHLGVGPAVAGDSIYNGFSDNAAGVAMLLEIARVLAAEPTRRTVAFLFTSGEERGLLGATYFASYPAVPLGRIHAVLNLDAGAPPAPPVRWRVAGDSTAARSAAAAVVRERGWAVDVTGSNANSDHWPFQARGVPGVFLVPGRDWEGLDDAARDALFERWDRYHQPGDEWREGFPLSGLGRYADLALAITRALAGG